MHTGGYCPVRPTSKGECAGEALFLWGFEMAIFFRQESTTLVEVLEDNVFITQFDSDEREEQTGQVVLSRRQLEEIFNHSKQPFKDEG
jgi:hypothetical protein